MGEDCLLHWVKIYTIASKKRYFGSISVALRPSSIPAPDTLCLAVIEPLGCYLQANAPLGRHGEAETEDQQAALETRFLS